MRPTIPALTTLRLDRPRDGVAVLTLDRPDRYNAMTLAMFDELEAVAEALDREPDLRVLVLTGAGKAFCAGYDLADAERIPELGVLEFPDLQEKAARALAAVRTIRVPIVAAVNGPAAGSGLALALAADIRLAAPAATLRPSFVTIGLSAGDLGVSWLLPRLIGPAAAAEFCDTARRMGAEEAERVRLVNRVGPAGLPVPDRPRSGRLQRRRPRLPGRAHRAAGPRHPRTQRAFRAPARVATRAVSAGCAWRRPDGWLGRVALPSGWRATTGWLRRPASRRPSAAGGPRAPPRARSVQARASLRARRVQDARFGAGYGYGAGAAHRGLVGLGGTCPLASSLTAPGSCR